MTLRRSFYLSFGRFGGSRLIQFVTSVVLARLLTPAEIGVFVVALAVIMTLGALRDFGIPRYLLKEREITEAKLATVFGVSLLFGWSLAAALYLGRHAAARFYGAPELAEILAVLAVTFLLLPIGQPALGMLRREQRHGQLAVNTLGAALGGGATSITFAVLGFGPISMAYGALVAAVLTSAHALHAEPAHLRLRPSLSEWRGVLGFGAVATAGAIVAQLGANAPALLVGRPMGFAETGLLQRASSVSSIILAIILNSSSWVTGAAMGARYRADEDISMLALRTTDYLAVIGWPALVVLALKAEAVIYLLYGAAWLPATPLVPPLCIAYGVTIFASQAVSIYDGTGAMGLQLRNYFLGLVVAVAFLVIGAQYSLVVLAWLRIPAMAAQALLHFSALRRYAGIGVWQMTRALRRAFLVTAGFTLAFLGMILLEPEGAGRDPVTLLVELIAAGMIYIALLFACRHPLRQELARVAGVLRRFR
ncbi:MAG: oligosaccharide flippase family protein [Proteobacteria bacterium]|nr:oligosaccharide flippase family protein [Pseudomonadota bacterium]